MKLREVRQRIFEASKNQRRAKIYYAIEEAERCFGYETENEMKSTVTGNPAINCEDKSVPTSETLGDGQYKDHWVLSDEERAQGYVRPVREQYKHEVCGVITRMPRKCAETYAVNPGFYGSTFCCGCGGYFPVGEHGQFVWLDDGSKVGT